MVYNPPIMRFKRVYQTQEARLKLGIHPLTLWAWGEKGKIRMIRDANKARFFDADEIDALAKRMSKKRYSGATCFPEKK